MSRIAITYKESVDLFKQGNDINFETIFDEMKSLAKLLAIENKAQENYLLLIQSRQKEVAELKKLNIE